MSATILVVDDTEANVRLLRAMLERADLDVVVATNGVDALDIVSSGTVDLVLLDIQMPGMNGYEVCRRIRESPSAAAIPVVMVTAFGGEERINAFEAGADDIIHQPVVREELLARVRSLLRIRAFHDTIAGQAAELAAWSEELERQVAEQVAELDGLRRLRRFLPPHLAEAVLAREEHHLLEDHRAEVAVAAIRLHGFDEVVARAQPEEAMGALRTFHDALGRAVAAHGATVGHSTGDRVLLLFGDPVPTDDPIGEAEAVAADLVHGLGALRAAWRDRGIDLAPAVGIGFGFATLGTIGFEGRFDYSAVGPVVLDALALADDAGPGGVVSARTSAPVLRPVPPPPPAEPAGTGAPSFDVRVLGPLECGSGATELSSGKARALLVRLALEAGRPVTVESLALDLWPDRDDPDAAIRSLRVHVSRLRKALQGMGLDDALGTRASAYVLEVEPGRVDAIAFDRGVDEARGMLGRGEHRRAAEQLRSMLSLWRQSSLAEANRSTVLAAEAARLHERRLAALEDCLDAELACGEHARVVAELESLVHSHPLRERFWAQRMLALHRCGRQVDALRAFQDFRQRLVEDLGLEPSPELRRLESAIARRDPALEQVVSTHPG